MSKSTSNSLKVPQKGDSGDADSGYDDPGVMTIPVVKTVIHNGDDGRKSSTTSTEWFTFKKKGSKGSPASSPRVTVTNPRAKPQLSPSVDADTVSESRSSKEVKNESDHKKTYHFIGRSRMGRGPYLPTVRDVSVSNSVHLKEETVKRTPRRKIRSKSADSRGSQNLFSSTYSKILSPETMRKRKLYAEILKRDNILEEEYYKLPYEDINREIVLGHRLSSSETRLNIMKGFERRLKTDSEYDFRESDADDSWKSKFDSKFENHHTRDDGANIKESSDNNASTNAATNDLKNLIEDLINGSTLGENFSIVVERPNATTRGGTKSKNDVNTRPIPKPRTMFRNNENLSQSQPTTYEDAILSNLDGEINSNFVNSATGQSRERLIAISRDFPEAQSEIEENPDTVKRKLTKYDLLNQKIDECIDHDLQNSIPVFNVSKKLDSLPPLPPNHHESTMLRNNDHHPKNLSNFLKNAANEFIGSNAVFHSEKGHSEFSPKMRAKLSNSSDEGIGIANVSYSSQGSTTNSKDDLTNDDLSPKFSNLKRGRRKLKKKVSFSTESDEMFYPSTDSDSCAFDEGSPVDADSGSESYIDDQELVVVRSFEVEGPFCVRTAEPFIVDTVKYIRAVDQDTIPHNEDAGEDLIEQFDLLNGAKDNESHSDKPTPNYETKTLPAEQYNNSYLTNANANAVSSTANSKLNVTNYVDNDITTHEGNNNIRKQSVSNKNHNENSYIPRYDNIDNSRLLPQQIYCRDPSNNHDLSSEKTENSNNFKGDYVNIEMTRGRDFTQHEIYLRTHMRTHKPIVTVTRMKVPYSSIRDQWDWFSPLMMQHRQTFESLARDYRNERLAANNEFYQVPVTYVSSRGEATTPTSSSCGSPTFSAESSSGCFSSPSSPSPTSPRYKGPSLPTPL